MSQWKNTDDAANSVIWISAQLNQTVNTVNQTALYGNTTSNAYFDGVTIGQYAADENEVEAAQGAIAHTGYVLRTEGQGNRAGRVFYEVLVAGEITNDASDDTELPDYVIIVNTQPADVTADVTSNSDATSTFSVNAVTKPAGGTITYNWLQSANGVTYVNAAAGTSGNTTATLTVNGNTIANAVYFKVTMSVSGGASVNSAAALYTEE